MGNNRLVRLGGSHDIHGDSDFYQHLPSENIIGVTKTPDRCELEYHAYTDGKATGYKSIHGDKAKVFEWVVSLLVKLSER